jgi:hypothetical protein
MRFHPNADVAISTVATSSVAVAWNLICVFLICFFASTGTVVDPNTL